MRRRRVENRPPEGLRQIYPEGSDAESEFDIIAIHGLNTSSDKTWTWRDRKTGFEMNWLSHEDMLRKAFPSARIFTYDWPAQIFKSNSIVEQTTKELARRLLLAILSRDAENRSNKTRYILFIASCLGGLILLEALIIAAASSDNQLSWMWKVTGGIIFLGTPFRGTAFQTIAKGVSPFLKARATLTATVVTELFAQVQGSTLPLQDLLSSFTEIYIQRYPSCQVKTFYEKEKSNPLRKALPSWLADIISKPKILVDSGSARPDISVIPIGLDRPHILMNKFKGPECIDYKDVVKAIDMMHKKFSLDVDDHILEKAYSTQRLQIQRLSGDDLDIDQCYINLAIVQRFEKSAENVSGGNNRQGRDSHLSLLDQLRVEEPDKSLQIPLSDLFIGRDDQGNEIRRRRIFIQGRAGVGKTTLCKRIVHGFKNGTLWWGLYRRLLWVPLRNLKEKGRELPDYKQLFRLEYFPRKVNAEELAEELQRRVEREHGQTLFLLDGLDEVSWGQGTDGPVSRFIKELLNQDDVIITSRLSHFNFPGMRKVDLHLETIGFTHEQVQEYLRMSFQNEETISEVRLFLEARPLLAHLFRIPIQLDALCYTWETALSGALPRRPALTMTTIYQAVEEQLWRKDICKLKNIDADTAKQVDRKQMDTCHIQHELALLEVLAFVGLHSGIANFPQDTISELEEATALLRSSGGTLLPILGSTSFLRTPDPGASPASRIYHFIHLTYQEYFAARYFVRQWKAGKLLDCRKFNRAAEDCHPHNFLLRHKYNARYDMMWRFAAGLLASTAGPSKNLNSFFNTIDKQSRDLLGPAHHRLIIHCLHEVALEDEPPGFAPLRKEMEHQLQDWLLSDDKRDYRSVIAKEVELPLSVLNNALEVAPQPIKSKFLEALSWRTVIHPDTMKLIIPWLRDSHSQDIKCAILVLIRRNHGVSGEQPDQLIIDLLKDKEEKVRLQAIYTLASWTNLSDSVIQLITEMLNQSDEGEVSDGESDDGESDEGEISDGENSDGENSDGESSDDESSDDESSDDEFYINEPYINSLSVKKKVSVLAVQALAKQSILSAQLSQSLTSLLENNVHRHIKKKAVTALGKWQDLPDQVIDSIASLVGNDTYRDGDMEWSAVSTLLGQLHLPDRVIRLISNWLAESPGWLRDHRRTKKILKWPELLDRTIQVLTDWIEHHDDRVVRCTVIDFLKNWPKLSSQTLQLIAGRLEDEDRVVRRSAAMAIGRRIYLSEEAARLIARCINHEDATTRRNTIKGLKMRPNLPTDIIQLVAGRLEDDDDVMYEAITTLQNQPDVPDSVTQSITELIQHDNSRVRKATLQFLASRRGLVQEHFELIIGRLEDEDIYVRTSAFLILNNLPHRHLPDRAIELIVGLLYRPDPFIRSNALGFLVELPSLPQTVVESIVSRLDYFRPEIREWAILALSDRPDLPDWVVDLIIKRLSDSDEGVKLAAVRALKSQPNLPSDIVQFLAQQLADPKFVVRDRAMETLGCQSHLPDNVIQLIAERLDDTETYIRQEALSILLPLSDKIPNRYIKSFYRELRNKGFWQHTSWVILDRISYITDGDREILFRGDLVNLRSELDLGPEQRVVIEMSDGLSTDGAEK